MLAGTLAFTAGIYCLMQFSFLPSLWLLFFSLVFIIIYRYFYIFRISLFFILGFCWALLFAHLKISHTLDPEIENVDVFIKGVIIKIPETSDKYVRFLFKVEEISDLKGKSYISPGLVRLSWYKNQTIPVPGEKWQFKARLKQPYGFMNTGGFDYEAWMLRQGISATGYIKVDNQNKKTGEDNSYFIQKLRYNIAFRLKQILDKPFLGIVLALTLGDRSQLDSKQWQVLSQTGTSHLIAISGLHLSLVAGFIYFFSGLIWRQSFFLTQRIPASYIASMMAFIGAFVYALLAGFGLPTQRALIMIGAVLIATFSARQLLVINIICFALLIVLILDPFAVVSVDFYLSFMAVIFILYVSRFRINQYHDLTRWIRLQFLLSFALCPILIFWFKQIPFYSVFANLVAIPVVGFLVVPLNLIGLVLLFPLPDVAKNLFEIINTINGIQWSYLELLSDQNNSIIPIAVPNLWSLLLAIIGVLILIMPRGLPSRGIGCLFFLPLLFPMTEKLDSGEFDFNLLDVGQGLAAVIQTQEHALIFDSGAKFSERFNIGDAVIKPYLRQKGIERVSMLIISHADNDHIGGADAIINNFEIEQILTSVPAEFYQQSISGRVEACYSGQKWNWDGVSFEILHPAKASLFTGNNASCVLKVSSGTGAVLLTGDIEQEAEQSLINNYEKHLDADILLVPHHGSKTSSTKHFISAVSPKYAFISAGYRNRFGFPKKDIINRYDAHGVKTFVSNETGELTAKFRDEGLQIDEFRTKNRRFWHH